MILAIRLIFVLSMGVVISACSSGSSGSGAKAQPAATNPSRNRYYNPGFAGAGQGWPQQDPSLLNQDRGDRDTYRNSKTVTGYQDRGSDNIPSAGVVESDNRRSAHSSGDFSGPLPSPLTPTEYDPATESLIQNQEAPPAEEAPPVRYQPAAQGEADQTASNRPSSGPVQPEEQPVETKIAVSGAPEPDVTSAEHEVAPVAAQAQPLAPPAAAEDPMWTPGLARPAAATPYLTGWERSPGIRFTDTTEDYLLAHLQAKVNQLTDIREASSVFAKQITNIKLTRNSNNFTLQLQILESGDAKPKVIVLKGMLNKPGAKDTAGQPVVDNDRKANLLAEPGKGQFLYKAVLKCWDVKPETCGNSTLQVSRYKAKPETVVARAYVVHRLGNAGLTVANEESAEDKSQKTFNRFLLDSFRNSCLQIKATGTPEKKAANEAECPGTELAPKGAKHVLIKSWAIIGGKARFSLIFQRDDAETFEFKNALIIGGDLVTSQDLAQHPDPLKFIQNMPNAKQTNYAILISPAPKGAELMANDGTGNMNFHIRFKTGGETRFSISTDFAKPIDPKDKAELKNALAPTPEK